MPSAFVLVEAMPLTPNGKLDRRRLPAPDVEQADPQRVFVPPDTPTEQLLAEIWREILGIERISRHDSFFSLGGHSLLAVQVIGRLYKIFQVEVYLRLMFEAPTLSEFAEQLDTLLWIKNSASAPAASPVEDREEFSV